MSGGVSLAKSHCLQFQSSLRTDGRGQGRELAVGVRFFRKYNIAVRERGRATPRLAAPRRADAGWGGN